MKTIVAFSFALALLCASPLLSKADQGKRYGMMNERMQQQLGLNEDQKNKIAELKKKYQAETKPLFDQKKSSYKKMSSEETANMSDAELRKIHDHNKSIQAKLADLRFEHMLSVRGVLTPEQRKKMYQLKQDRKQKFKTRRGKMRERMNEQE